MRPGTRANVECKPSYTHIGATSYSEIICGENGQWSEGLFSCHRGKNVEMCIRDRYNRLGVDISFNTRTF